MADTANVVEIEVCERLMDYRQVPVWNESIKQYVLERRPKYHAQIKDEPGYWGCGDSRDDAIGSLVRSHPERFGIKITHLGKLPR